MEFKPEYVRCTWSPELEGKQVIFSDSIDSLWREVVNNKDNRTLCEKGKSVVYPFKCCLENWRFVYYDPNYSTKIAHEQGKKIEWKRKGEAWEDWEYTPAPAWLDDNEYRIMQEKENTVTNRELARWLAQGKGEFYCYDDENGFVSECGTELQYPDANAHTKVVKVKIRKWEDEEWQEPSREYMGLEEK